MTETERTGVKFSKVFVVGPTESLLTQRGNRHPALAQFLVNHGYLLEYVTSDFYHAEKRWFSPEEVTEAQQRAPYKLTVLSCLGYRSNISVQRIISNILLSLKVFFYLLPRLNSSTILILPSRPVEMIFAAAMLRLLRKNSVLLDIQDIWPDMLVVNSAWKKFFFRWYCNAFLFLSLRFINKFIHVAPSFSNWLKRYAPKAKSIFIPLGFDGHRWKNIENTISTNDNSTINFVYIGMMQRQIDLIPILEAIKDHKNIFFTIVGDSGDGEKYKETTSFIKNNRICNVKIVGRVSPNKVINFLENADIGIVPMVSSSIPNKVFDYIACEVPILVLGENDSSSFVNKLEIGWSCDFYYKDIKQKINQIDKKTIKEKKDKIFQIKKSYDRDNLFLIILELINSENVENFSAYGVLSSDIFTKNSHKNNTSIQ